MEKISKKTEKTYNINGQIYKSFEELPESYKKMFDKDGNGKPDFFEQFEGLTQEQIQQKIKDSLPFIKEQFTQQFDINLKSKIEAFIKGVVFLALMIGVTYYYLNYAGLI